MLPNPKPLSEPWRLQSLQKIPLLAASLAFQTILAIVPIFGLGLWYLKKIGRVGQWADDFKRFILEQLNVAADNSFITKIEKFIGGVSSSSWGWIGIAVLIYTGLSLIFSLGRCFDFILEARGGKEKSSGIWARLTFVRRSIALPLIPLLIAASLAAVTWLKKGSWIKFAFKQKAVGPWIAKPLPLLIDWFGFFIIYYLIPREKVALRYAARAALLTTPLYEGGKFLMQMYAKNSFATAKLYGALSVIPIFMIWVQAAWMILLSGAITFPGPKQKLSE
jgi:membrane protein